MALTQVTTGMVADAAITPAKMQSGGAEFGMISRIINGKMEIAQRGTSFTNPNNIYTLDRWNITNDTTGMVASQSSNAPNGYLNSLLWTNGSGSTPGVSNTNTLAQGIEGFNTTDLAFGTASAQPITLVFWVKSSIAGQRSVSINNASAAPYVSFTRRYIANYTINSANTWEKKIINIPGDTGGSWMVGTNGCAMAIMFDAHSGSNYNGTAGAWGTSQAWRTSSDVDFHSTTGATLQWTGVDLYKGTFTDAIPQAWRTINQEITFCKRYYEVQNGYGCSTSNMYASWRYFNGFTWSVEKRVNPSIQLTILDAYPNNPYSITNGSVDKYQWAFVDQNANNTLMRAEARGNAEF